VILVAKILKQIMLKKDIIAKNANLIFAIIVEKNKR